VRCEDDAALEERIAVKSFRHIFLGESKKAEKLRTV
jgi:hypothetical protein